jgi:hypothetical protein
MTYPAQGRASGRAKRRNEGADPMTDEITAAVASALAEKAVDTLAGAARTAWTKLVKLIRKRFAADPAAAAALTAAQTRPTDQAAVRELAAALQRAAVADASFAQQLEVLWRRVRAEPGSQDGPVVNVNSGTVSGHLIQARDLRVEGGFRLGLPPEPEDP